MTGMCEEVSISGAGCWTASFALLGTDESLFYGAENLRSGINSNRHSERATRVVSQNARKQLSSLMSIHPANPSPSSSCTISCLAPDSPERTCSEPGKERGETNGQAHPAKARFACAILRVFVGRSQPSACRHEQENTSDRFQPQIVQRAAGGTCRRRNRAAHRPHNSALACLPGCNPGDHRDLLCGRNLAHGSILTAFGATMAPAAHAANLRARGI